jgi:putative RecB family exonuclease
MIGLPAATMAAAIRKPRTRDYLSYSAISTYRSCPLSYMFRYVVGLTERTVSSSLVFGSAIHQGIEYFFNELMSGGEPPPVEALLGEYDRHWESVEPSDVKFGKGEDRDSLGTLAQRMFAAFKASDFARPAGRILGVEEELRASIVPGCPELLGRLDLIAETNEAVVVSDLKTSRSRWSSNQVEESSEQLLLYHELVKTFIPTKRVHLHFAVLTKANKPDLDLIEVPVIQQRIDRTKLVVERVWRAIQAEVFYPAPSAMQCSTCSFRTPCRDWTGVSPSNQESTP